MTYSKDINESYEHNVKKSLNTYILSNLIYVKFKNKETKLQYLGMHDYVVKLYRTTRTHI